MITIDGSFGEGGGQILRTSIALSLVTGLPCRIANIRAGRQKPGLLRQHLTAVAAAAAVGGAEVSGAVLGSKELTFAPRGITAGDYQFAIGTAGSATLVLQTVLPALLWVDGPSSLTLEGGTHNPMAPPFDFLDKAFLPLLNRMGANITGQLQRYGFYPAGGGKVRFTIQPAGKLQPIEIVERGKVIRRMARAVIANLRNGIAERELDVIRAKLSWPRESLLAESVKNSAGPGNVVLIEIESENVTEVFSAFGERGVPAESVADKAATLARRYLATDIPVGEYLADQLLIPMALAGGGSFVTVPLSRHTATNIEVIREFLDVRIDVSEAGNRPRHIVING